MGVNYKLGDAVAVAKVHEGHSSELSALLYPSGQGHCLACIFDAEFSAGVCSVHMCLVFIIPVCPVGLADGWN